MNEDMNNQATPQQPSPFDELGAAPTAPPPPPGAQSAPLPPLAAAGPHTGFHPPTGTYPSPNDAPAHANLPPGISPALVPPQKTRRVGTFTMALCLIFVGLLLLAHIVFPGISYITIARFSPLILVLFGVEILVANALHRDAKLKYDILSVFISLVLIGGSLIASVVPEIIHNEFTSNRVNNRLEATLQQSSADALGQLDGLDVTNIEWYVNVQGGEFSQDMAVADIRPEHYVQVRVFMPANYADKLAFTQECKRVADVLLAQVPHINYASFYSFRENSERYFSDVRYSLWIENSFQFSLAAETLAQQVESEHWYPEGGYYISEWEHNDRLQHPENYGIYEDIDGYEDEDGAQAEVVESIPDAPENLEALDIPEAPESPDGLSTPPAEADAAEGEGDTSLPEAA